jgi:tetratricopeptide (TPR) repeat protein
MSGIGLLKKHEELVDAGKWEAALPVIKEIVDLNPGISTSWFNYGVCLDELKRHGEAAEAFIKAQETDIRDVGVHYRILRSLRLAKDYETFFQFMDYSIGIIPEILRCVDQDPDFDDVKTRERYRSLKENR